jgi:HK97 family phage prohead protease
MDGLHELTTCKAIIAPKDAEVSVSKRQVTSYKSIFGNVDRVREIVEPGAFLAGIGPGSPFARGQVPTRHNHETLVGKMIHAEEDSRGLLTTDQYGTDPVSDRVFSLVRDGILTTSSFKAKYRKDSRITKKGPDGQPVHHLTALTLTEAGPADPDYAVNPDTHVVAVKGLGEVAAAMQRVAGLDGQERYTAEGLAMLTDEERDMLVALLSGFDVGRSVQEIIASIRGEQAADYSEATGKAMQLSDAIAEWEVINRLEKLHRRLSAAN